MSPTVSAQANASSAYQQNSVFYKIDPNNVGVCLIINQKNFHIEQNPQHQVSIKIIGGSNNKRKTWKGKMIKIY